MIVIDLAEKSADYCMKTLRRQLEFQSYQPIEWALNSACLSQFFITRNLFAEGKHCLACANFVLNDAQEDDKGMCFFAFDQYWYISKHNLNKCLTCNQLLYGEVLNCNKA